MNITNVNSFSREILSYEPGKGRWELIVDEEFQADSKTE